MMDCMGMMGGPMGGAMMLGMWVFWLLLLALTVLGIVALLKYLRTPRA